MVGPPTLSSANIDRQIIANQEGYPYVARFNPVVNIKIDKDFSQWQKDVLKLAFDDWERASNYKIKFEIKWDEPKPGKWIHENDYEDNDNFMWRVDKKNISPRLQQRWSDYLGLMLYNESEKSGNVIIFDNTPDYKFYSVALHEIGHFLGLKHINGAPVVMHPNAVGTCLSRYDVELLCSLYGCEPISQCPTDFYEDEPNKATRSSSVLLSSSACPEVPEESQEFLCQP